MNIQQIPLSSLIVSDINVRKTGAKDGIDELAANIHAVGLLQNLLVCAADDGKFEVVAGGRRLAAMHLLVKQDKLPTDWPVPCEVRDAADPALTEISLSENELRREMHPADQFDAFSKLAEEGRGPEEIAARFGTTPAVVERRLKLARVSPKLLKLYRADEITLDQLMAFAIVDDHKQQEKVWKELPEWAKHRGSDQPIREALTGAHVSAKSRLAAFLGVENYQKAGGAVLTDLFSERGEGWLTDPALVNRLVGEKLEALAATVREEGWKFVEAMPEQDWQEQQKQGRLQPNYGPPKPETQEEAARLQTEADAIMAEHGEEPDDEDTYIRLGDIQERINEIEQGEAVWTAEQKAVAGVVITIGHNGEPSIRYGVVKPEDKAAAKKLIGNGREPAEPTKPKEKAGLSAALIADLTSHKNAATAVMLAEQPTIALIAVAHGLAISVFYTYGNSSHCSLQISGTATTYPMTISDTIKKSVAGKKLAGLVTAWKRKIPSKPELLWAWLEKQKPETVQGLLAVCAALTVDIVQSNGAKAKRTDGELTKALKLNMADWWEATAATYFLRVAKPEAVRAVTQACGKQAASDLLPMKKANMAAAAERRIKGKKWLPEVLRP